MSARTARRTRLFAATTVALAALALTACENGQGVEDEGPSSSAASSSKPSGNGSAGDSSAKPSGDDGATTGNGSKGSSSAGSGGKADGGTNGSTGGTSGGTSAGAGDSGDDSGPVKTACTGANTTTKATVVSRPVNHMLITVTNTGSKSCNLVGYPYARFGEAQAVPPVAEETKPQAVVTLAPGESGYAGVLLSSADGSGENGYTAKTLEIAFGRSGATAHPSLPAKGVWVDEKLTVTYWQSDLSDALTY
ncbi:DUF4232 domain-containing protein [Streptomyces sp. NPDC008313]|uniref:DUF4232 domain-containing protein n=1 Tax=Streptomyces sp. NPDC008313 TaxID=3364826 RepID=UPI0036EBEB95